MNEKKWFVACIVATVLLLGIISGAIIYTDPYFHYHEPHTDEFYYKLYNQRSINDGIMKNFEYDAMIIGTSMTECFLSSELDELFDAKSIKVPTSGASYYEVDNNLRVAIENNPELRMVVRCLDTSMYFDEKDRMRRDLGTYPKYLYDDNIFNDVKYFFNRDLLLDVVFPMFQDKWKGVAPGIESFDNYSNWYELHDFGPDVVYPDKQLHLNNKGEPIHICDQERQAVIENIEANVCATARENPHIQFYYYLPPYSAAWWQQLNESGELYKYLEAERIVIEQILACENIKLFSVSNVTDITTDLNHYKDTTHYGPWINSMILIWMSRGEHLLTEDNYEAYLADMEKIYTEFDYNTLLLQEDYKEDNYAARTIEEKYGFKLNDYTRKRVFNVRYFE